MTKASVSVVIPCFNSVETIERAVSSIAKQTLLPEEVIIVNDCSTDNRTKGILIGIYEKYNHYFDLKIINNKTNQGPGVSRNIGWNNSKEEYIAFLDADDAWDNRKIELQYEYMINNKDVHLTCHGNMVVLNKKNVSSIKISDIELNEIETITYKQLLFENKIATRSVMLQRSIKNRFVLGKYHSEDYLLWLEIASSGYKIVKFKEKLSISFSHPFLGNGLSGNLVKMYKGEIDSYKRLTESKKISKKVYPVVLIYSTLKFLRRILISVKFNVKQILKA
ncbi:MAG: glycosyltransferase family 2 protein [Bacillota bacterium]